jgi:hypothetical protein
MSITYTEKYGPRPVIGIYSNNPELITDTNNLWSIQHLGPMNTEFYALVKADPINLTRHLVRVHDRNIDTEFGHVIYMFNETPIDLSYLANWIDLKHTTFIESNYNFAVYRRDNEYSVTTVDFDQYPESAHLITRSGDNRAGVIFIDCWPIDFKWQHTSEDFDFYKNMLEILDQYPVDTYAFHTSFLSLDIITPETIRYIQQLVKNSTNQLDIESGFRELLEFSGDEQLAPELTQLAQHPKAVLIPSLDGFKKLMYRTGICKWIVVGMHWGICTHQKALGFDNLKKIKEQNPQIEIYSIPQCTARWISNSGSNRVARLCNKSDYDNDSLKWEYFGNIARLKQ